MINYRHRPYRMRRRRPQVHYAGRTPFRRNVIDPTLLISLRRNLGDPEDILDPTRLTSLRRNPRTRKRKRKKLTRKRKRHQGPFRRAVGRLPDDHLRDQGLSFSPYLPIELGAEIGHSVSYPEDDYEEDGYDNYETAGRRAPAPHEDKKIFKPVSSIHHNYSDAEMEARGYRWSGSEGWEGPDGEFGGSFGHASISGFRRNPLRRRHHRYRRNPDPNGNPWGPQLYNPLKDRRHKFKNESHYNKMIARLRRNPW